MNCDHCGNRNPSTADHCLHCGARFDNKGGGGFFDLESDDPDSIWNSDKLLYIVGAVFVAIIGGSMLIFGFDTYDVTCVHNPSDAARYNNAPEWERDESAERRYREREELRHRKRTGSRLSTSRHGYLRCFKKKTGHVDGALSK